jgi:hypothetical protein
MTTILYSDTSSDRFSEVSDRLAACVHPTRRLDKRLSAVWDSSGVPNFTTLSHTAGTSLAPNCHSVQHHSPFQQDVSSCSISVDMRNGGHDWLDCYLSARPICDWRIPSRK